MRKRIFQTLLLVSFTTLLLSVILSVSVFERRYEASEVDRLYEEAEAYRLLYENAPRDAITGSRSNGSVRLTLIAEDGTVLYDSFGENLENHSDRAEVQDALLTGRGSSVRMSSTLSERTFYAALRAKDGSVVRCAYTESSILRLVKNLIPALVVVSALVFALSALFSSILSRKIVRPINTLDLDNPLENDTYAEISPLLTRLDSQERRIDRALRELERRKSEFDTVSSSMAESLILLSPEMTIVFMNSSAKRLFVGQGAIGGGVLSLDHSLKFQDALKAVSESGKGECIITRGERVYEGIFTRIDNAGYSILFIDVTERVKRDEMRRNFSSNVSHELKSPLHSILASSEMLEEGMVKNGDEKEFYSRIRREAKRLLTLIDDIIGLSKLDEGKAGSKVEFSVVDEAKEVMDSFSDIAAQKNIKLSLTASGIVRMVAEKALVTDIISNLVSNAIRYGKNGGNVYVGIKRDGGEAILSVKDDGIGIPSESLGRIFERFYVVDKARSRDTGGTGLGLSIVKHSVMLLNGSVDVESEVGKGSVFTVRLPLV